MKLVVTIDSGRADAYRGEPLEMVPPTGLRCSRPIGFEPVAGGWHGDTTIDGARDECERDLAQHLRTLAEFSRTHPEWPIRVAIEPDGGELELRAGSFGIEQDEVEHLLRWTTAPPLALEGAHDRLCVSVRLPEDAHRHFLDLVAREIPKSWPAPVTTVALGTIALGFELSGDATRTAQLISAFRAAWVSEGSGAQCLVELEGPRPIVRRIDGLPGWSELERELRSARCATAPPVSNPAATIVNVARIEVARVVPVSALAERTLTWIEDSGRILGLGSDGLLCELAERVESVVDFGVPAPFLRRRDGSSYANRLGWRMEVPKEITADRRLHGRGGEGFLITDRSGADTRLRLLCSHGVMDGPVFRNVRAVAIVGSRRFAVIVAEVGGFPSLVTVDLANWGWDYVAPWPATAEVTDLVALGTTSSVVAVANVDGAGHLSVMAAYTGELEHTAYVPCSDLMIVKTDSATVWLTGSSPVGRASRHDLVRVDLAPMISTTLLTSGVRAEGWGALHAAPRRSAWILAYERRGVFVLSDGIEAVAALESDERITSTHIGEELLAVFTTGPRGSKLMIGDQQLAEIPLPAPAYQPLVEPGSGIETTNRSRA